MDLNITKPIVFFDLETTGIDVNNDHIVELCYIKLFPDGRKEEKNLRVRPTNASGETVHIPQEASDVHGIYDEDVKDCPSFRDIAETIYNLFKGCDIAGYNSNHFDVPLLVQEFYRAGFTNVDFSDSRFVDVCVIYKKLNERTLSAAYRQYYGKDFDDAHSANADTRATLDVLKAMLDQHTDVLENDITQLSKLSSTTKKVDFAGKIVYNDKGEEIINFGKYQGKTIQELIKTNPGYISWMLQNDFPEDTKQAIRKLQVKYGK